MIGMSYEDLALLDEIMAFRMKAIRGRRRSRRALRRLSRLAWARRESDGGDGRMGHGPGGRLFSRKSLF